MSNKSKSSELVSSSVTAKETVEALMADKEVAAVIVSVNTFKMPELIKVTTLMDRIKAWGKSAHESQLEIVLLAKECLLHFHNAGDATAASYLVKECPMSLRKQALIAWFKASAPLTYSDKTGEFTKDKTKDALPLYKTVLHDGTSVINEKAVPFIQAALLKPFYDMFKEPKVELFDEKLTKPFKTLLSQYTKSREEGLIQQSEKVRVFMDKVRLLQVEAEEIQSTVDEIAADATIAAVKGQDAAVAHVLQAAA
jgi:hypothetical protein